MRLIIDHRTDYSYDPPVAYALQQLRLTPKSRAGQEVIRWSIAIEGIYGCTPLPGERYYVVGYNRVMVPAILERHGDQVLRDAWTRAVRSARRLRRMVR